MKMPTGLCLPVVGFEAKTATFQSWYIQSYAFLPTSLLYPVIVFTPYFNVHHQNASYFSTWYCKHALYLGNDLPRHDDDLESLANRRALEPRLNPPACEVFGRRIQIPHAKHPDRDSDSKQNQRNPNRPVSAIFVALGAGIPHAPRVALRTNRANCGW